MNNKGRAWLAWTVVLILIFITLAAIIDPFKVNLDASRSYASGMNCPGSADFNQVAYDAQNTFEKLNYRTTCFATGLSMVYFVGSVGIAALIFIYDKIRK